ncbi:MAG: iron ABC transporter permease [Treponema sp.]|nr:iron ABC transporter permease [Treponema sp.]
MDFSHILRVAWFTFFQATLSTLMALLIGIPAAFFCGRRNFPARRFLLSLSAIPFCLPSLLIALGYVTFLGVNGGLNRFLMFVFGLEKPPVRLLYSFVGLIIAHGFYNFPLIMKNLSDAWERLPLEPAESARLLGASEGRIFRTLTLHQLMPSIASSSLLVFIYCFLSFILVLLFGGIGNSTLEVEIYKAARATLDYKQVGLLALIETSILIIVTILYTMLEQKTSKLKGLASEVWNTRIKLSGAGEISAFALVILLIAVFFLAPLLGIVFNAFTSSQTGVTAGPAGITLSTFRRVIKMKSFWPSVASTIKVGACTGFLCILLGFAYSLLLQFLEGKNGRPVNLIFKVVPMLPMAISSVVVGVLITMIVHRGNVFCLILAQSLLNWPLAFRVIYPHLSKINRDTMDASLILSKSKLDIIWRVLLPVSKKSLITAFGFCFAISAGDTTLPLVLAIPRFDTLSLFTYRLAGAYRFNEACAAGVILGLICALVFVITGRVRRR